MALADHAPTSAKPKQCAYALAIPMLTKTDAATLQQWVNDGIPARAIARALRDNGTAYVGDTVINEHRRGKCVCAR